MEPERSRRKATSVVLDLFFLAGALVLRLLGLDLVFVMACREYQLTENSPVNS